MMTIFTGLGGWGWAAVAAVLAVAEVLMPGVFLIWLAGAAAVTALIVGALAPSWPAQMIVFAWLAVIAVVVAKRWFGNHAVAEADPGLNRRADRMVGTRVTVVEAFNAGRGKVQLGDSPWLAEGPDLPEGAQARVVRVDGNVLVVEAA